MAGRKLPADAKSFLEILYAHCGSARRSENCKIVCCLSPWKSQAKAVIHGYVGVSPWSMPTLIWSDAFRPCTSLTRSPIW